MKKKILLLDESITVQKVVSLTLDKNLYEVLCAKSITETKMTLQQSPPDLVLVSDQTNGVRPADFPNEVASWVRPASSPALALITTSDITEMRGYAGVLKKPFSPHALQALVAEKTAEKRNLSAAEAHKELQESVNEFESQRFETLFNSKFADESQLVRETFGSQTQATQKQPPQTPSAHLRPVPQAPQPPPVPNLWAPTPNPPPPSQKALWGTESATPARYPTGAQPAAFVEPAELEARINHILNEIVPPIVERLVRERLDALLTEARKAPALQRSR